MVGILVRVEANAADRRGQQAHFLPTMTFRPAFARSWTDRREWGRLARALAGAIGSRPLDKPILKTGLTGELAKSRWPWDSGTSLSPGRGSSYSPNTCVSLVFLSSASQDPRISGEMVRMDQAAARGYLIRVNLSSEHRDYDGAVSY